MSLWLAQAASGQVDDYSEFFIRIVVAIVLGGLIGFERELRDKPAGFRTIILITLGACLFAITSEIAGAVDSQRTRIAAQVVSGIGFLGAGAILRDRQTIVGLTTAATIWAMAAVGLAIGFGHLVLGVYGAVSTLVALFLFDGIEQWIGDRRDVQEYDLTTPRDDAVLDRIRQRFAEAGLRVRKLRFHESGDDLHVSVIAMGKKVAHEHLRYSFVQSSEYVLNRS